MDVEPPVASLRIEVKYHDKWTQERILATITMTCVEYLCDSVGSRCSEANEPVIILEAVPLQGEHKKKTTYLAVVTERNIWLSSYRQVSCLLLLFIFCYSSQVSCLSSSMVWLNLIIISLGTRSFVIFL